MNRISNIKINIVKYAKRAYKSIKVLFCFPDNAHCENCSICLSMLKESEYHTKWICSHRFHKECIDSWEASCPICRCSQKLLTSTFYNYVEDERWKIEIYLKLTKMISKENSITCYSYWKHSKCISENHEITFHNCNPQVVGICHYCSKIDIIR